MKKVNMLRKNKDFSYCYRRGKRISTPYFTVYYAKSRFNKRVGFSVSRKIGKSVVRNKIRRRMKEIMTACLGEINSECSIIFVAKNEINSIGYQKMEKSVKKALKSCGLI